MPSTTTTTTVASNAHVVVSSSSSSALSSSSSRAASHHHHFPCSRRGSFAVLISCCASATFIYSLCQTVVFHPLLLNIRINTHQPLLYNNSSSSSSNYLISSLSSRNTRIENNGGLDEEDAGVFNLDEHLKLNRVVTTDDKSNNEEQTTVTTAPYHFVICTRIKNEAPYLREWIEYHRMIGFESFYLLNNDSTDATQCILDAYIKRGIVFQMRHVPSEHLVFDTCVRRLLKEHQNQTDVLSNTWMATHDVDEFIWFRDNNNNNDDIDAGSTTPSSSFSLQKAVHNLQQRYRSMQSMFIPRFLFGSSGHDHYQPGLVIKHYTRRFDPTGCPSTSSSLSTASGSSNVPQVADNVNTRQQEKQQQQRRRLTIAFDSTTGEPTSFCNPSQNVTTAYHGAGKGMTLVPVLALDCRFRQDPLKHIAFCQGTHFHKLRNTSDPNGIVLIRSTEFEKNPTTLGDDRYVGDGEIVHDIAIMHFMTRSREEFFKRTCSSRWIEKYQRCKQCSPETYFNMSETYTNNFVDDRMAPFAKRLETILALETNSSSSSSLVDISHCETSSPPTKPWDFYRTCWQSKRGGGKKPKVGK